MIKLTLATHEDVPNLDIKPCDVCTGPLDERPPAMLTGIVLHALGAGVPGAFVLCSMCRRSLGVEREAMPKTILIGRVLRMWNLRLDALLASAPYLAPEAGLLTFSETCICCHEQPATWYAHPPAECIEVETCGHEARCQGCEADRLTLKAAVWERRN